MDVTPRGARRTSGVRILPLIGTGLILLSVPLAWAQALETTVSAANVPLRYLTTGSYEPGMSIGVALLILAGLGAVLFGFPNLRLARRAVGAIVVVLVVFFIAQTVQQLSGQNLLTVVSIREGAYLALLGGALVAAA